LRRRAQGTDRSRQKIADVERRAPPHWFNASNQPNGYEEFPTVGSRYVAWAQEGSGGLAYDTVTGSLLQLGSLTDFRSWGGTAGDALLWADRPSSWASSRLGKNYYALVP